MQPRAGNRRIAQTKGVQCEQADFAARRATHPDARHPEDEHAGFLELVLRNPFAEELRNPLLSGKFNGMLSLLFGVGFTIQFERMRKLDPQRADDGWMLWGYFGFCVQMAMTMPIGVLARRRQRPRRIPELLPRISPIQRSAPTIGIACGAAFTVMFALNRVPGPSPIKLLGGICY